MSTEQATIRQALINELGLTLSLEFIPTKNPENIEFRELQFNYSATILRNGKPIITTEYHTGIGWVENMPSDVKSNSYDYRKIIYELAKHGKVPPMAGLIKGNRARVRKPTIDDVLHSLLLDGSAVDSTFEDWADECGYDQDSRKAYAAWEQCRDTGLKLIRHLGRDNIEKLQEAFQDY